ncbi:cytochrome c [Herbaspirillum sp. Sphag1AN]|uniref:c-type cytochrome n=1 Tax=unclassified Herbaspirillum TaxID=2624150 RepID=UPI0017D39D61|nr:MULTISPECIES: c-type cytochrome [unclassified Herbaspirillum]MBB3214282.1 cytochrome c [Herbaspirillum sp. Sphag1AN]MBB3247334.1 cytochrome c [Herbaspirillum sp. Sphag64]
MKGIVLRTCLYSLLLCTFMPVAVFAAPPEVHGQVLYQQLCASCHSIAYNGVGPAHQGVFNRKAGSAPDYEYSPALKESQVIWSEKTLDQWLRNPEQFIPGNKMGFLVASPQDRADLIAYLKHASTTASDAANK